ncbi:MAG: ATP-dependent protease ATPase subunit HslU [Gammaproteobacteria bacterium]|nr:ATP-dependent protease ATPase subunit HslU [Gammaproteobacteria bacterium]
MSKALTPIQTVQKLDKFVIGQGDAKKLVAIALRNRWRRLNVDPQNQNEIMPNNILMIGPTGVGKTEIARRLAKLVSAPFIKVEATKFTEVGYVGKDVESIIRDLIENALHIVRKKHIKHIQKKAQKEAYKKIVKILIPKVDPAKDKELFDEYYNKVSSNEIDDQIIEITLPKKQSQLEILAPPGMEEMTTQLQGLLQGLGNPKKKKQKITIEEAKNTLIEISIDELIDEDKIKQDAIQLTENEGIVFLDEIDKLARSHQHHGEVSREGVQRDLLPLVEGTVVQTKYGNIETDHILFIASGAFMETSPNQLISELQGRFPIRVKLNPLTEKDLADILTKTEFSLIKQYQALLQADNITLTMNKEVINLMAHIAYQLNEENQNLGARRLNQVIERVLEEILFEAPYKSSKKVGISAKQVRECFEKELNQKDLSQWII